MKMQPGVLRAKRAGAEEILTGHIKQLDIARQLRLTVRTLNRHLLDAKTSFHEIRDESLCERAEILLRDGRLSVAEVSYLVG